MTRLLRFACGVIRLPRAAVDVVRLWRSGVDATGLELWLVEER